MNPKENALDRGDETEPAKAEFDAAMDDFFRAARLAHYDVDKAALEIDFKSAPHYPPGQIPNGRMAVYGFFDSTKWLKIGKVGPNSSARYVYQHYRPGSAQSTLAASLLNSPDYFMGDVKPTLIDEWMKRHLGRVNVLIPAEFGPALPSYLEAFLHLRLTPVFEGTAWKA